jgi:hypothetical protein
MNENFEVVWSDGARSVVFTLVIDSANIPDPVDATSAPDDLCYLRIDSVNIQGNPDTPTPNDYTLTSLEIEEYYGTSGIFRMSSGTNMIGWATTSGDIADQFTDLYVCKAASAVSAPIWVPSCLADVASITSMEMAVSSRKRATTTITEDFSAPVVATNALNQNLQNGAIPAGWLGATEGFGANRRGIVVNTEAYNDNAYPQAFGFRYTNSGLVSSANLFGTTVTLGSTYSVSFMVVQDSKLGQFSNTPPNPPGPGLPYLAQLVGFAPSDNRGDFRVVGGGPGEVLATASGNAPGGTFMQVTFQHTVLSTDSAAFGLDLALRFFGATDSAVIADVQVTVPQPTALPLTSFSVPVINPSE